MDEIERKRAYKTLGILIDAVDDPTIQNALRATQHMIMDLETRLDNLVTMLEEDEDE